VHVVRVLRHAHIANPATAGQVPAGIFRTQHVQMFLAHPRCKVEIEGRVVEHQRKRELEIEPLALQDLDDYTRQNVCSTCISEQRSAFFRCVP
jgi:hypothetical protein